MKDIENWISELSMLLEKGNAHVPFDEAVADIPLTLLTVVPEGLPYSIWQLAEHIRITQWDIVEFCLSEHHVSPKWPEEYWPKAGETVTGQQWKACQEAVQKDRNRFIALLHERAEELTHPFPYGEGQSLLREALLIADHTAYHLGEILVLRRLLHCWK
ncbi:MAG: DinB family protein [Sphingobacteriales bacterium]|nr:MAG: DinB family protein [Sphingobacteriales bacterium]